jgi:hypothetical protein
LRKAQWEKAKRNEAQRWPSAVQPLVTECLLRGGLVFPERILRNLP